MKSFIVRLFNCCHPNREYDDIDQLIKSRNDDNKLEKPPETSYLTSIQIDTEESSIISTKMETSIVKESQLGNSNKGFFNDRLIREEERQHITFVLLNS